MKAKIGFCAVVLSAITVNSSVHAANVSWVSAVSGNWSDGTKWSTGSPPDPNDDAFIDVPGTYTVTLNVDATAASLTLGDPGQTGTQTVNQPNTTATFDDINIGASGRWRFTSFFGATLTGGGTLINDGTITNSNSGLFWITMPIINNGVMNFATGDGGADYHCTSVTNNGTLTLGPALLNHAINLFADQIINTGTITGQDTINKFIEAELINTGMVNIVGTTTIDKPDAQHELGAITLTAGNLIINQSGSDPTATLSGSISLLGRTCQVTGGTLELDGGQFVGGGRVDLDGGVTVNAADPNDPNGVFNVPAGATVDLGSPACTINTPVCVSGSLITTLGGGHHVFHEPLDIKSGGWAHINTGNGAGGFICNGGVAGDENAPGLLVEGGGRLTMHNFVDGNDNGRLELFMNAGPLVIDPNGVLEGIRNGKYIYATSFVNRGLIDVNDTGNMYLEQITDEGDFPSYNYGLMHQTDPQGDGTINVIRTGATPFINETDGEMFMRGSVTGSFTNYGLCRGRVALNFFIDVGESLLNVPGGTMEAYSGDLVIQNIGGLVRNDGLWVAETDYSPTIRVAGDLDNYDPVSQTLTGGHLRVRSPGEFCAFVQIREMRSFIFHCINELKQSCSSGQGNPGPFSTVERVDPNSALIIEDMPFGVVGDLDIEGTGMFVNGAVLNVPGQLHSNGTIVIHDSTLIPNSVLIGNGELIGDNSDIQGNIVNNGGILKPGQSPGRFDAMMDYTQGPGAGLEIELAGTTAETEYDVLAVGQTATLGGTLEVLLLDGFVPSPGDTFEFLTAASVVGQFDTELLPEGPGGLCWDVEYMTDRVRLVASLLDGDVNGDRVVNISDLGTLLSNFGLSGGAMRAQGDLNGDGNVNISDLGELLSAFGSSC